MAAASFKDSVQHGGGAAGGGALGVHGASRKIGKQPSSAQSQSQQQRKPVIIYMVSPKIIHVEAHEFMSLVQRLTGPDDVGGGDRERASTSSPRATAMTTTESARKQQQQQQGGAGRAAVPVRVKARALNRPGPAVSVSVTATRQSPPPPQQQQGGPPSWAGPSPSPSGFLFHDLSPLRGGALKGEAPLVSPWLHHVGDHFLSPGAPPGLGSPSAFLDIFGPLSSHQHQ